MASDLAAQADNAIEKVSALVAEAGLMSPAETQSKSFFEAVYTPGDSGFHPGPAKIDIAAKRRKKQKINFVMFNFNKLQMKLIDMPTFYEPIKIERISFSVFLSASASLRDNSYFSRRDAKTQRGAFFRVHFDTTRYSCLSQRLRVSAR